MDSVTVKANAKINLALDVLCRRTDGYHDLRMIMQTLSLHDTVFIKKNRTRSVSLTCDFSPVPTDRRNLAYQAASLLIREYGLKMGVRIHIKKRIPMSAGLAGGSSDCAAALIGLNRLFSLDLSIERLLEIGLSLGSDVPFCLTGGSALAEGRGEKLTPLAPHPPVWVVLAKPPFNVSTREVFKHYDPAKVGGRPNIPAMLDAFNQRDLCGIAGSFGNVLTGVTAGLHPEINAIIDLLKRYGALNACMSGSGPTAFGYFTEKRTAETALSSVKQAFPRIRDLFLTSIYNERNTDRKGASSYEAQ